VDGLKGFPEAIATVYPKAEVQLCIVHMVRNSLAYVNWKERKRVAHDLRQIYQAVTVEEAEGRLLEFEERWGNQYAVIGKTWRRHWAGITPLFAYPAEIRRSIYTTNIVESLHMSLRKVIKTRGSFPSEEAALKLLYLALKNVRKRWQATRDWKPSLNHFTLLWGSRFEQSVRSGSRTGHQRWQRPSAPRCGTCWTLPTTRSQARPCENPVELPAALGKSMPLPLDRPSQMLVNCGESARDKLLNLKRRPRRICWVSIRDVPKPDWVIQR